MRVSDWFDEQFAKTVNNCSLLTREEAEHFVAKGYVLVRNAFNRDFAEQIVDHAWDELRERHEVERDSPETWLRREGQPSPYTAYYRVGSHERRMRLKDEAPTAFQAQVDVVGGSHRLPKNGDHLSFGFDSIANLGLYDESVWRAPCREAPGWHKDGWHFRHFLDSPEQGLLTVPIYSDIQPRSGATVIATDSIGPVSRKLAAHPEGFHADSVQGGGYLIPYLADQCNDFQELMGNAGDMAILHPFMLHRVNRNPSDRHRFIANIAVVLNEPMRFDRPAEESYSLAELAVLRALQQDGCDFTPTEKRRGYVPAPFRDKDDARARREELEQEMSETRAAGLVTPEWGADQGYMSNRSAVA